MSFTFVVEDGTGLANSTSYAALDFANAYAATNPFQASTWNGLSDAAKQNLLMFATRTLDNRFQWAGEKAFAVSALRWPRYGAYDRDGFPVNPRAVPVEVQEATVEMAIYLMQDDWTAPRAEDQFKELDVDVITVKYNTDYRRGYMPDSVVQILDTLGTANTGRRPRFVKIVRS